MALSGLRLPISAKMRVAVAILLVVVGTVMVPSDARSSGAPAAACADLTPSHPGTPQSNSAPYTITFTPNTFTPGDSSPITVTLTAAGTPFKGFLLTTEYENDDTVKPGTFVNPPANTQLACSDSAVTHSSSAEKTSLSFTWTPPATAGGNIRFRATFVQSYLVYWVNVKAASLLTEVLATTAAPEPPQNDTSGTPTTAAQPDPNPTTTQPPSATQPPTTAQPDPDPTTAVSTGQIVRDSGCGINKGCYSDCSGDDCSFLISWAESSAADSVAVRMSGTVAESGRYIALGLSEDDEMGDDSVVYCINAPNGAFLSHNVGRYNQLNDNPKEGLSNIVVSYEDGILTCTFNRVKAGDSNGQRFGLDKPYTLFYAVGPGSESGTGQHENIPLVSTQSASLVDFEVDIGGSADFPFIKAHGSLMIVAWIFAASIGIVFARYFKNMWEDTAWCGEKIWFQIHRACMITAALATITAFVIIFVEVEGYSDIQGETYKRAHPILGIIVTALTVINPIMAAFRPHPGTPNRPIYNWAHWAVGSGAHILAVITIFFGLLLDKAGAPDYIIYILAAYVGWQVLVQLLMEIAHCMGRNSDHSEMYEMSAINGGDPSKASSQKGQASFNKRLLISLHVLVITGFTLALIIVLNIGEDD